jgi:hypothetical protein
MAMSDTKQAPLPADTDLIRAERDLYREAFIGSLTVSIAALTGIPKAIHDLQHMVRTLRPDDLIRALDHCPDKGMPVIAIRRALAQAVDTAPTKAN